MPPGHGAPTLTFYLPTPHSFCVQFPSVSPPTLSAGRAHSHVPCAARALQGPGEVRSVCSVQPALTFGDPGVTRCHGGRPLARPQVPAAGGATTVGWRRLAGGPVGGVQKESLIETPQKERRSVSCLCYCYSELQICVCILCAYSVFLYLFYSPPR